MVTRKKALVLVAEEAKRPRGRPASGLPPDEVAVRATRARRERLLGDGKQEFKTYLSAGTKDALQALKVDLGLDTTGEVIDHLVQHELLRRPPG